MTPDGPIKVFSELRDLQIFDSEDHLCGICDDVEFDGAPGEPLKVAALLVGPGAYRRRLPGLLFGVTRLIAGAEMVRVAWPDVAHVTSRITLNRTAQEVGLDRQERRLRPLLKKVPLA